MFVSLLKRVSHYYKFSLSLSKHDKCFNFSINYFKNCLICSLSRTLIYNFVIIIFNTFITIKIILLFLRLFKLRKYEKYFDKFISINKIYINFLLNNKVEILIK